MLSFAACFERYSVLWLLLSVALVGGVLGIFGVTAADVDFEAFEAAGKDDDDDDDEVVVVVEL